MKENWVYRRGDLYLANLGVPVGSKQGGVRPVVVLQNDVGNYYAPTITIAPLTSKIEKKRKQPTHFFLRKAKGLAKPSMVLAEQLDTCDKVCVIRYLGRVSKGQMLLECLKEAKKTSTSDYVVANRDGDPLSYTQFKRLWQYIVTRTTKERCYYRYEDGKRVKHTVKPVLGQKAAHNGNVVYSLDFEVTPHQLRHTYITNLIHASVDPKTVQYLAGHESSKITMDIYAKVKYNRPEQLAGVLEDAFASWD